MAEENRAKAAEDDLETAINNEEDRATAAEEALQASINAEAQAARQAEQANATAIANEATRAKAAEASLSTDIKTMDSALYKRLTGQKQNNNLRFLDELQSRGIDTWVRHVVVPGLTDDDKWLHELGRYVASRDVVKKIEVLPYHTLGTYKYAQLGLDYPLEGVSPLSAERIANARAILSQYKPCL